jgi:hypothetical protein
MLFSIPFLLQSADWENYGYAKYLFSSAENSLISNDRLNDHQLHLRFNNRLYFQDYYTAGLEIRMRGFYGSSVEKSLISSSSVISPYPYNDLSTLFVEKEKALAYGQIDRLFVDYSRENWQITIGRQRIAWGTSMVWNIVDLFNPLSVLDFDYEEKPGSDAVRVQYFTDMIGRLELVAKPAPNKYEQTIALLYLINQWDYDFYFIAAWHRDKPFFGAAFSGDIEGAGFRGEIKSTQKPTRRQLGDTYLPFRENNFSQAGNADISAVISLDYTFPNSLYLHSEYLYNSLGKTTNSLHFRAQSLKAGLLSATQSTCFFETAYMLHPLLRGNVFTLINPHEGSLIWAPSLSWSIITNLDLYLVALISDGRSNSEFSAYGKTFFLRSKYSF